VVLKAALLLLVVCGMAVADEGLDRSVLSAIFPGAKIEHAGHSYVATGPTTSWIERCASEVMLDGKFSDRRLVELQVFEWPGESTGGLAAVVQYEFEGARPAGSCWSIGLLAHLRKQADGWQVKERYLLDNMHHASIPSARMVDLAGTGIPDLVVESDGGGAGVGDTNLHIFDLSSGAFHELLHVYSFLADQDQEGYSQTLDIARTRQSHGAQFCFVKTLKFDHGVMFPKPKISHPCYKPGEGINPKETAERNAMLKPLPQ
jgi:hypothetical protein